MTIISQNTELTLLKPGTILNQVEQLCKNACANNYAAVCIAPLFVKKAKEFTEGTVVKVATVIGYPYGFNVIEAKLAEIIMAMVDGADELNLHINITALKNNDWQYLAREINTILPVVKNKGNIIKVVVESSLLLPGELIKCCDIYGAAGVNYFSLSSGIQDELPSLETVRLVRKHLADAVGIMVTGNFNNSKEKNTFINADANVIGSNFIMK